MREFHLMCFTEVQLYFPSPEVRWCIFMLELSLENGLVFTVIMLQCLQSTYINTCSFVMLKNKNDFTLLQMQSCCIVCCRFGQNQYFLSYMGQSECEAFGVMRTWIEHQILTLSVGGFSSKTCYLYQCISLLIRKYALPFFFFFLASWVLLLLWTNAALLCG